MSEPSEEDKSAACDWISDELDEPPRMVPGKVESLARFRAEAFEAGRVAGLQQAAKMCEAQGTMRHEDNEANLGDECDNLAAAIRATPPEGGGK